jgi:hypothetical protein
LGQHPEVNLLPEANGLDISSQEVRQLWSFLDGSIMNVDIQHPLWKAWASVPATTGATPRWRSNSAAEVRSAHRFSSGISPDEPPVYCGEPRCCRGLSWSDGWTPGRAPIAATTLPIPSAHGTRIVDAPHEPTQDAGRGPCSSNRRSSGQKRTCPACLGGSGPICRLHLLAWARAGRSGKPDSAGRPPRTEAAEILEVDDLEWPNCHPGRGVVVDRSAELVRRLGVAISIFGAGIDRARCPEPDGVSDLPVGAGRISSAYGR